MSFDLDNVRNGLALALKQVPGLRAAAFVPPKILPPIAIVGDGGGNYDDTFSGEANATIPVLVVISRTVDRVAQRKLDAYVSTAGAQSVPAAILANRTLPYLAAATVDDARVTKWDAAHGVEIGGVPYFCVEFHVEVLFP